MRRKEVYNRDMAKKSVSENKDTSEAERHFGIVLEDINKTVHQVLDGHAALDKKVDNFYGEFSEFRNETNFKFETITSELSGVKSELRDLKSGSKQILEYLSKIDDEIGDLKRMLIRKADLERLEHLEQRVAQVELVVKKYYGKNSD